MADKYVVPELGELEYQIVILRFLGYSERQIQEELNIDQRWYRNRLEKIRRYTLRLGAPKAFLCLLQKTKYWNMVIQEAIEMVDYEIRMKTGEKDVYSENIPCRDDAIRRYNELDPGVSERDGQVIMEVEFLTIVRKKNKDTVNKKFY